MLGISIYPEKSTIKEIKDYIVLAEKYGFKRIFTCLLSAPDDVEAIKADFTDFITFARDHGFEVILDVAPSVFDQLGISYDDLTFFKELGASGIRLDVSYNGATESEMTFNPQDLDIEINMSMDTNYLNTILDYEPNKKKLFGCHNFYPQRYCGLNYEYFVACSNRFKEAGIRSAAFINARSATTGPWPHDEGICTLEMHRDLPSTTQLKHYYAMNLVDDIIIANQFASEEELKQLSEVSNQKLSFRIETSENNSEVETKILFEEPHFNRGDVNDYLVRSTMSRVVYKQEPNAPHDVQRVIPRGSIVIGNDNFGQYKNELQIVKKDIIDEANTRNVVGRICEEELFLLDLLKPWQKFKFEK